MEGHGCGEGLCGFFQHGAHWSVEPGNLLLRQAGAGGEGVDACGKKEFVSVDVADACDDPLVAEQGLDWGGALGEAGLQDIDG